MKNYAPSLLGGKFTKLARAFSRNYNVVVNLNGFAANTDGSVINLPANADWLEGADSQCLEGLLDHEWSHVAEEEEAKAKGQKTPLQFMREAKTSVEKSLYNVFEDIRIEIKWGAEYPGVAENLKANNDNAVKMYLDKVVLDKLDFWSLLGAGIICRARDLNLDEWAPPALIRLIDEVLADEMRDSLVQETPADAWDFALRTIEKMKEEAEAEGGGDDDDEEDGDEESKSEGGEGGESKATEGESEKSEGESEKSEGEVGKPTSLKAVSKDDLKELIKEATGIDFDDDTVEDFIDFCKDQIEEAAIKDATSNHRYLPHPEAKKRDAWERPTATSKNKMEYAERKIEAKKSISAMRSKLLSVLRIQSQSFWAGDRQEGVLDASSLHTIRSGNRRIFAEHMQGQSLDTVVSILVDESGSMAANNRWLNAQMAVIALAETLDAINIPFEVVGFDNGGRSADPRTHLPGQGQRVEPLKMREYKSFADNFRARSTSLACIRPRENNTDGEALLKVAERLIVRKEQRKLLLVLSDGQPAAQGSAGLFREHLKTAARMVTKAGIELVGIGIQTHAVEQFYNKSTGAEWVMVNNLSELAPTVMKVFRKKMLGARRTS